jgi:hypothetical protein
LHFLYIAGFDATNYETVFVHIQQEEIFPLNKRTELRRQAKRFSGEVDKASGYKLANFSKIDGYFADDDRRGNSIFMGRLGVGHTILTV